MTGFMLEDMRWEDMRWGLIMLDVCRGVTMLEVPRGAS